MPPRRSHKKSKAGCQRCKLRKIKCDEVHPQCGNCVKHGVVCDFDGNAPSPTIYAQSSSGSPRVSVSTPASHLSLNPGTPSEVVRVASSFRDRETHRSLELRLMHHWTAATSQTLSMTAGQKHAWQIDVPSIAYNSQYLMDAILAVAALHLRVDNPDDQTVVRASHSYMASALSQYSSLLNKGLSATNAEALFATSALIAFQASASRRFENHDGPDGYSLPLSWFHSFQGVKTVVMASWQWLRYSDRIFPIINGQPALRLDLDPNRKSFFRGLLEGMDEQLKGLDKALAEETKRGYEHAVSFLDWAHRKPERSRILGFAATVSRRFVELIAEQDPRALVITSSFFAMTKVIDEVWWLNGVAKREVTGIMSLVPREWWSKMDWAVRISNSVGPIDEESWGDCWHSEGAPKVEEGFGGCVQDHIDIMSSMTGETKERSTGEISSFAANLEFLSKMIPTVGVD
ncbi:C6 zinc finger protein [Phlyctema vagabunda]|uniref:C6 zinc finger protein n=1 Tax=Phlyctema vagabunda TaxID=108571 RepID=A0ABR4P3A3_9HELO